MMTKFMIPSNLKVDYFYGEEEFVEINPNLYKNWNIEALEQFSYEILFEQKIDCFKPWERVDEIFPYLLAEWKKIRKQLDELYKQRNVKEATSFMKKGLSLCIAIVFWSNNRPIILKDLIQEVDNLEFLPVNFSERLSFIVSRPNLYQSFKTLEQLMIELEKLFVTIQIKKQIMNQKKSSKQ